MEEKKTTKTAEVKEEKVEKKEAPIKEAPKNETKEKKEPVKGAKGKKDKDEKSIVSRILNVVLWIVLFAWMLIVFSDYIKVKNEEEPRFCWGEKTTTYDDGIVVQCSGLGYKVINYKRASFKAIEFGPFWIKDRTAEDNK